jgi:hypothetical protein
VYRSHAIGAERRTVRHIPTIAAVHATVVIAGALVPAELAAELVRDVPAAALAEALRRACTGPAERLDTDAGEAAHWQWLWRAFNGVASTPVTAPYAWRALNPDSLAAAGDSPLWFAEPVHFALQRDDLSVQRLADPLSPEHAQALAAEADAALREAGGRLLLLDAARWFIRFDAEWELTARSLDAAVGRSPLQAWPRGNDAARWRRVHNEIQMRWHEHPVNAAREAAGQRTANALWLHGGGRWQTLPPAPFDRLLADDPVLRGWMLASGLAPASLAGGLDPSAGVPDRAARRSHPRALALWLDLHDAACSNDWAAWRKHLGTLDAAFARLRDGGPPRAERIDLILSGREHVRHVRIRPSDRWRLWRRNALAGLLAEPETP